MTLSRTEHETTLLVHQGIGPRRLLPKIIDVNAAVYPTKLYSIFPKSNSIADGLVNYDYKQLANAINHVARYLDDNLPESLEFDTFAYIGSKDIRYSILAMAALKTRRKVCKSGNLLSAPHSEVDNYKRFCFRRPLAQ